MSFWVSAFGRLWVRNFGLPQHHIFFIVSSFGIVFWVLVAAYEHSVLGLGTFWDCLLRMDLPALQVRATAVFLGVLGGVAAEYVAGRAANRRRLETLFEKSNDAYLLLNGNSGRILEANSVACRLLGYTYEHLKKLNVRDIHPHDFPIAREFLEHVVATGGGMSDELSCRTSAGGLVPAEVSASAFIYDGQLAILVGIRDITERHQAEEKMRQALAASEKANRAKKEFLANMSHELRTPLNAVMGFSDLIRQQLPGPSAGRKYVEYASHIHSASQHLLGIVNDMLDVSRIDFGTFKLVEQWMSVHQIVDEVVVMLRKSMVDANLNFNVTMPATLPELYADPLRIKQILVNLLSNAIKFTPAGGEVRLSAEVDKAGAVVFVVEDNGIGIAPDKVDVVFDPFVQAEATTHKRFAGIGLGLSLVRSLTILHDGKIELRSEEGKGTNVRITLPATRTRVLAMVI